MQAEYQGMPVFAKRYNPKVQGSREALQQEYKNFQTHAALQGDLIPKLHTLGYHPGTTDPILILEDCGDAVPEIDGHVKHGFKGAVRNAITKLHAKTGCCHGDLRPANMLTSSDSSPCKVMLIDLANMRPASKQSRAAEAAHFEKLYM